jgi:hypothetical protein
MRLARPPLALCVLSSALAVGCTGLTWQVQLALPVRPKLPLTGHEKLYVGPFVRESRGDEKAPDLKFDVPKEFERYLRKLLRKEAKFVLVPAVDGLRPPTSDPLRLEKENEFWRQLGTQTGADYIVAGSVDFQVQDRTAYQMQPYESPVTGQTYYRNVLVEQTGFVYDIMLIVYDGRTGSVVYEQPLKDFQEKPERNADEFTGMFSNLFALENQIIGVFVPRTVQTRRVLFTP